MKARGLLGVLACTAAVLSAMPATASGATGKAAELKVGGFELKAPGGFEIEVENVREGSQRPIVGINVKAGLLQTSYDVRAEGGPGLHATFGSLGQLDVSFERQRRVVERPEAGCRWVFEEGIFRGSFHFVGEGEYVSSEAVDPKGSMLRLPDGFCGFMDDRRARPFLGLEKRVLQARTEEEGRVVSFAASQEEFVRLVSFNASLRERVDGMNIERSAETHAPKSAFTSTGRTRATVHPPKPFSGSAQLRDPAHQPASWTGTLSVSFLGAPEIALAGEAFKAQLCPRISILSSCLKSR
ncbi:MAG TPA: hypothetical protein VNC16_09645 [Solirubrobacterales bacterium]|jgi:hypothetical protein|nr:hypothetical protein [Solirubrobacterales bacterium]